MIKRCFRCDRIVWGHFKVHLLLLSSAVPFLLSQCNGVDFKFYLTLTSYRTEICNLSLREWDLCLVAGRLLYNIFLNCLWENNLKLWEQGRNRLNMSILIYIKMSYFTYMKNLRESWTLLVLFLLQLSGIKFEFERRLSSL